MPAPDDLDRDKFYASGAGDDVVDDDDDGEYELEGPDPAVLEAEKRRRDEALAAVQRSIDIDEIYREQEHDRSSEILHDWADKFRLGLRFQVKHILIATAVLAIGLTLWRLQILFSTIAIGTIFSIIGVYLYLQWKEKQHQDKVAARRREIYARRREAQANAGAAGVAGNQPSEQAPLPPLEDEVDKTWKESMKAQGARFRFSLAQMMLTMMGAALVLGFITILGGPQEAATVLGMVALLGLIAHGIGFEPPPIVALGWWLLLLFYVVLSFFTVLWSAI